MKYQVKEQILRAAKNEFSEKGFDGARMGEIAKKAGVNQAMIHYYFQSKEHLYEQVIHRLFTVKQINIFLDLVNKSDLGPSERLYLEIYLMVHISMQPVDQEFERIFYMLLGSEGIKRFISIVKKYSLPAFQLLESTIKSGIEKGEFETYDATLAAFEIFLYSTHYMRFYKFFEHSDWYEHMYGKNSTENAFNFFIRHTFKALCPAGKNLNIPVIPDEILKEVEKIIDTIIRDIKGGLNE